VVVLLFPFFRFIRRFSALSFWAGLTACGVMGRY